MRSRWILLLLACGAVRGMGAHGDAAFSAGAADLYTLVRQLGHPDWRLRQEAHAQLTGAGARAIDVLMAASESADPEIALRARSILDVIDPCQVRMVLARVLIPAAQDRPWRITETLRFQGVTGALRSADGALYTVTLTASEAGAFHVGVSYAPAAHIPPAPLAGSGGLALGTWTRLETRLHVSLWEVGLRRDVERETSFLLAWAVAERRSGLPGARTPHGASQAAGALHREELVEALLEQAAAHPARDARLDAGELLARLGEPRAIELLEPFAGDARADAALVRLGVAAARARLQHHVERAPRFPEGEREILELAEAGSTSAVLAAASRMNEMSSEGLSRACWLVGDALDRGLAVPAGLVPAVLQPPAVAWNSALTHVLHALAARQDAHEELLPAIEDALDADTPAQAGVRLRECLRAARVMAASAPPTPDSARRLARAVAPHTVGPFWQDAFGVMPYIVEAAGPEALAPLIDVFTAALDQQPHSYALRNALWAAALVCPPESSVRRRLIALLADKLADLPRTQASQYTGPLAFLLGVPDTPHDVGALLQAARAGDAPPEAAPAYELHLWTLRNDGDDTRILDHQHVLLAPWRPAVLRDRFGNARVLAVNAPPARDLPPGAHVQVSVLGMPRPLRLEEPALAALFGDIRLQRVWLSDAAYGERHQAGGGFLRTLAFLRIAGDAQPAPPLAWEDMVAHLVGNLARTDASMHTALQLVTELKLTAAAPELTRIFQARPSIELAEALAALGEASAEPFLRAQLAAPSRQEKLRAVRHFLSVDARDPAAVTALLEVVSSSQGAGDLYALSESIRAVLAGGETERERLLAVLAGALNERNASAIIPLLREATGLDFGYFELIGARQSPDFAARMRTLIARWKDALGPAPTDKGFTPEQTPR